MQLISDPAGLVEFKGSRRVVVSIHVGPAVEMVCRRAGQSHRGTAIHGDIDVIPAHTPGVWELQGPDAALVLGIDEALLKELAAEYGRNPDELAIRNRFQVRDVQIEHLAWALKAEMEKGYPSGRLYLDGLAIALGARLVRDHSSFSFGISQPAGRMAPAKLKEALTYIESHLSNDIRLRDIAAVAGLSVSHFKAQFRRSVGMPAHRYLIRRRVEHAAALLRSSDMPIDQVALESGFAHPSHLAMHTRRIFGLSPRQVRDSGQ